MEDGLIKVVSPIDDTPASKAGIMANDIITKLDDEAVQGLTLNQAVEKMRGPVNTKIRLKIIRKGQDNPIDVTLVRDNIRVRSVRARVESDDIAYIRITTFNEQTTEGLKREIGNLSNQIGDKLKGYIIDLRNNPGRPAGGSGHRFRRLPGARRDRLDPRPQCRGNPAPRRPSGRPDQGQAGDRADQWRLGLGVGNRRRRAAGPQARDAGRHPLVRQGLGADHHPARQRQRRAAPDHGALLHAVGQVDPGQGHRSRYRGAAGRAGRAEVADRHQGRSLAARPSEDTTATRRPARNPTCRRTPRTTRR